MAINPAPKGCNDLRNSTKGKRCWEGGEGRAVGFINREDLCNQKNAVEVEGGCASKKAVWTLGAHYQIRKREKGGL